MHINAASDMWLLHKSCRKLQVKIIEQENIYTVKYARTGAILVTLIS